MSRIYVDFIGLLRIGITCRNISKEVSEVLSDFQQTIHQLDWDVKYQSNINDTASQLSRKLDSYAVALKHYQSFMNETYDKYRKLDQIGLDRNAQDISPFEHDKCDVSSPEEDKFKQLIERIKATLSAKSKINKNKDAGLTEKGISYLQSLYQFFSGDMIGLTGAENYLDLCDNSIGLWIGFYDYLKHLYNNTGGAFSTHNQAKVAGAEIVGSILGFVSDIFGTVDTISNTDDLGTAGLIGEIIGTGDGIVDIWSNAEKLIHVGDTSTNVTTSNGVYSPLAKYSAIAKGYISALSQGFSSYEKYSADGVWDVGDTGATAIELSTAGLYSMIKSLSFGLFSEETTGISASDISSFLENTVGNIGTKAGQYIAADPTLYQKYQNSSVLGRTALTFYAAVCSL